MSGRISAQGSVIMISDDIEAVNVDIASATKAKPCVITLVVGATAPEVGTIVVPRDTGWNSIEYMPFKVKEVTLLEVTLEDSDTTREANEINVTGTPAASMSVPTFLELCRSNFNATQPAGTTINVTTLCDVAPRIVAGLPGIGTWTAAGFYDCNDAAMFRAADYWRSGEDCVLDIRMPDGCGYTFMGIVNTFDITLAVNAAIGNTLGGQIDGQLHMYKTPPPGFVPLALGARQAPPRAQVAA